jgi:uncharacterized protein
MHSLVQAAGFGLAIIVSAFSGSAMADPSPPTIETIGSASVAVVPDMATIRIGVERAEKTSVKAFASAKTAINDVTERMKAEGIAIKDLSTSNLSLNPVYDQQKTDERGRPMIVAYSASVEITVIVRDIGKTGKLLDEALKEGSNQFNGIIYDVADKRPALDQARKEAALEAKRKAEGLAAALSLKLGPILRVYEPDAERVRPQAMINARLSHSKAAEPLAVEPGQIEISAEVGTVWTLAP